MADIQSVSQIAPARTPVATNQQFITSLWNFSDQALSELSSWLQFNLSVPITQVQGFEQFLANYNSVSADETSTSVVWVDLSTVGPTISGLGAGQYVVLFGARSKCSTGRSVMSYSLNGDNPSSRPTAQTGQADWVSIMSVNLEKFTAASNTITVKYETDTGGTAHWTDRFVLALRVANA